MIKNATVWWRFFCRLISRQESEAGGGDVAHPFFHILVTASRERFDGAVDGGEERRVVTFAEFGVFGERIYGVVYFALLAVGQACAGEQVVHGCAKGVEVCPRAHVAIGCALLGGAEARGFDDAVAEVAV